MTEKRLDLFKFWIHERPPDPDSMIESRGVIDVNKRGYMINRVFTRKGRLISIYRHTVGQQRQRCIQKLSETASRIETDYH